jgi:hypothetical protein
MNWRTLLGLAIIGFAFIMDDGGDEPLSPINYNAILNLEKQSDEVQKSVEGFKKVVTDQPDREIVAIFHNEMGRALPSYSNINTLQFEKYYFGSAMSYFGDRLTGKYRDLGENVQKVIVSTLGEDEGMVSKPEIESLSSRMRGIAWNLLN